jgi:hypothetical protein
VLLEQSFQLAAFSLERKDKIKIAAKIRTLKSPSKVGKVFKADR